MSERPNYEIDVQPEQGRRGHGPRFDFVVRLFQAL